MLIKTTVNFIILLIFFSIPVTAFSLFTNKTPDAFIKKSVKYIQNNDYESLTRLTYQYENEYDDYFYNGQKKFVDFIMKQDDEAFIYLSDIKWEYSLSGVISGLKETGTIAVKLKKDLKKLMTTDKEVINWKNRIDNQITVLKKYEAENKLKRKKQLEIDMLKAKKQDEADSVERERQQKIYTLEREKSIREKEAKELLEKNKIISEVTALSTNHEYLISMMKNSDNQLIIERKTIYNREMTFTRDEAEKYCYNLEYGGYTDWRLPTYEELGLIITEKKHHTLNGGLLYLDTKRFPNALEFQPQTCVWFTPNFSRFNCFDFKGHQNYGYHDTDKGVVRCVVDRIRNKKFMPIIESRILTSLLDRSIGNNEENFNTYAFAGLHPNAPYLNKTMSRVPLIEAVKSNNDWLTKKLLDIGADRNIIDIKGKTALDYSFEKGNKIIQNLLKTYIPNKNNINLHSCHVSAYYSRETNDFVAADTVDEMLSNEKELKDFCKKQVSQTTNLIKTGLEVNWSCMLDKTYNNGFSFQNAMTSCSKLVFK